MKFEKILATILSALMITSCIGFVANAEESEAVTDVVIEEIAIDETEAEEIEEMQEEAELSEEAEAELLAEADYLEAYRTQGYKVLFVKKGGTGDGSSIDSPKNYTALRDVYKNLGTAENGGNNQKLVIAVIGRIIGSSIGGTEVPGTGHDIIVTSATGNYSASGDYLKFTNDAEDQSRSFILTDGNKFTFDKIHFELTTKTKQNTIYTTGAEVVITESVTHNGDASTKQFVVAHGYGSATQSAGNTVTLNTNAYIFRSGAGDGNNINGDITYNVGGGATINILAAGGHAGNYPNTDRGTLKGSAYVNINNATVKQLNPGYKATVNGDVIVNVNGGTIEDLKTSFENSAGKLLGDYVIYLNDGEIKGISVFAGGTFNGKTVLLVNEDNADTPTSGIDKIPYVVKYTGNGEVKFDTATDKLKLTCKGDTNTITVNDTVYYGSQDVSIPNGTTNISFTKTALPTEATVTFDANGGAWGTETKKEFTVEMGDEPTAPETNPKKEGYAFVGWSPELSEVTALTVTYKAVWEANHINAYRKAGYDIVYVSDNVSEDGTGETSDSPRKFAEMDLLLNAVVTDNCKVVIAIDGRISSSWGIPTPVNGADVILTSVTGANGTNGGYITAYNRSNSMRVTMFGKGESKYTFDNIHIQLMDNQQNPIYAAGSDVKFTSTVTTNSVSKGLVVAHGRNASEEFTGGTIEIDTDAYILRSGSDSGSNIAGDVNYIIGENSTIQIAYAGGHSNGKLEGDANVEIDGGKIVKLIPGYKVTVNGNIIVNINDGGEITTLKTNFEDVAGKLDGDYVIYLNDGTIGTVDAFANASVVSGKTVLVVNENNAEIPANIADLQNLVSYTGDGDVEYNTATDKLVLKPGASVKFVRVTNGEDVVVYDVNTGDEVELLSEDDGISIDLATGTTTVEFLENGTIKQAFYKTYGTYDVENMTYTLDLVFTGAKVSAGSFGFRFPEKYMTLMSEDGVVANYEDGIVLMPEETNDEDNFASPIFAKGDGYYANTWTPEMLGYVDATEEEILVATFRFTMNNQQRQAFVSEVLNNNGKIEQYVKSNLDMTEADKYYSIEDEAYLVTCGEDIRIVYVPIEYVSHTEMREIVSPEYTTYGIYDSTTEEYSIDIKVKGGKINLGAFGLAFDSDYMTFDIDDEDAVVFADGIEKLLDINKTEDGYAFVYYASNDQGYIDATADEVLVATIKVGMNATQREAFVDADATMEIFEPGTNNNITSAELAKYFDGENYLVTIYEDSLEDYKVAAEHVAHEDEEYIEPVTYTITLNDLSGEEGETVTLTVSLDNYELFSSTGMGVKIDYDDSVIEFVRVAGFQQPAGAYATCDKSVNGATVSYTFAAATNVVLQEPVLFTAEFKLVGEPGEYDDVFSFGEAIYAVENGVADFATEVATVTIQEASTPEPETYTVTYVSGKGTAPEAVTAEEGATITLSAPEAFAGYVFYSWTDGTTEYFAGDEFEITGDVTLTAVWYQKGDANMNGTVNVADAIWIFDYISGKNEFINDFHKMIADMNDNSAINVADAIEIFNFIAS